MGAKPIGSTSRPRKKPNSLRPPRTKIQQQRENVLAMLEQQKQEEIRAAAIAAGHEIDYDYLEDGIIVTEQNLNFDDIMDYVTSTDQHDEDIINLEVDYSTSQVDNQPTSIGGNQIVVKAKSNFGGLNPMDVEPGTNVNPSFNVESNNAQLNNILTTPATKQQWPIDTRSF